MMTRGEALRWFEKNIRAVSMPGARAAHEAAIRALRPVSREQELEAENKELKERIVNWRKYMTPTREQVEKVWRGEWIIVYDEDKEITIATCSKCGDETAYGGSLKADDCDAFCPVCGAPMTDEAVEMVMERLEALKDAES